MIRFPRGTLVKKLFYPVLAVTLSGLMLHPTSSLSAQSERLVVLVRHAEAGGEPENDPPLTDRGLARAAALAQALEDAAIAAVVVSPLARTRLTAEPLSERLGHAPIVAGIGGGLEEHVAAVAQAVHEQTDGAAVLVVGHSNTIPRIIAALGGPELRDLCHWEFSRLFVLVVGGTRSGRLVTASYGEPDEARDDGCPE